jgi:hypothetical protein
MLSHLEERILTRTAVYQHGNFNETAWIFDRFTGDLSQVLGLDEPGCLQRVPTTGRGNVWISC